MKLLVAAATGYYGSITREIGDEFEILHAAGIEDAWQRLATGEIEALLVHRELGDAAVLQMLARLRTRDPSCWTAVLVVSSELELRFVIEVMRAGAYDVLLDAPINRRELVHGIRNAAVYAQAAQRLARSAAARSREVIVVGTGDAVEAIVLLLEATGRSVRHCPSLADASTLGAAGGTLLIDLASLGSGEDLLKLLQAR